MDFSEDKDQRYRKIDKKVAEYSEKQSKIDTRHDKPLKSSINKKTDSTSSSMDYHSNKKVNYWIKI
jgi:hypothetical protein